jgi:uncharacterized protein YcbX
MLGQGLADVEIDGSGFVGDRRWVLYDVQLQKAITAKKPGYGALLEWSAALIGVRRLLIRTPHGYVYSNQADCNHLLSRWLGRPVELRQMGDFPGPVPTVRPTLVLGPDAFWDARPIHFVTTAQQRQLDALAGRLVPMLRFRPNAVLTLSDKTITELPVGTHLAIGTALLEVDKLTPRCAMPALAQGSLSADGAVTRLTTQHFGGTFGQYATVKKPGHVALGDVVTLLPPA